MRYYPFLFLLLSVSAYAVTPLEYLGMQGYEQGEIDYILVGGRIDPARKNEVDTRHKLEVLGYSGEELEAKLRAYFPHKRVVSRHAPRNAMTLSDTERQVFDIVTEASTATSIPAPWIYAIIRVESAFNDFAVSKAGADGLTQLMPAAASEMGVRNRFDRRENIMGGARYIRKLFDRFGDWDLALAAYVAGPETVERAGRRIPDYPEVYAYLRDVKRHHQRYRSIVS